MLPLSKFLKIDKEKLMKTTQATTIVKELYQPSKKIEYEEHGKYIFCLYPFQFVILKEKFNINSYDDFLETMDKHALYIYDYKTDEYAKCFNINDALKAEKSKKLELCYVVEDFNTMLFDLNLKPVRRFFNCKTEDIDYLEDMPLKDIKYAFEYITDYGEIKYDNVHFSFSMIFNRYGEYIESTNKDDSFVSFRFRPSKEQWDVLVEEAEKDYKVMSVESIIFDKKNYEFSLYYYAEFLSDFIPNYIMNNIIFR